MKKVFIILFFLFSFTVVNAQILNKLKKFIDEEEVVNILKDELINHLENTKKEYEAIDYNYAVSFSDNSGLYENEERYMRYRNILLKVLKEESLTGETAKEQAKNLNDAGEMLYAGNRFRSAELAFIAALVIYEDQQLIQSKEAALTTSNLGLVYHTTGRYSKAEEYTLKALLLRRDRLKDDAGFGASLNNLAVLYKDMGKYNEAETLFKKANNWIKKANGTNSNPYAIVLNNEAMLFQTIGRYEQAERLLNEAIAIAGNHLKEKSPNYIRLYVNLAILYQLMGELDRAEQIYLQALELQEKRIGHQHPDYASLLRNLAALYQQKENFDKVENYLTRARDIYKRKFGSQNAIYAKTTYELGAFYQSTQNLEKAEILLLESITTQEEILNEHHPDYTLTLENLAVLYWQKNKMEKASLYFHQVMDEYLYQINNYFAPMSEKEKAAFWAKIHPKFLRYYAFVAEVIEEKPALAAEMYNFHIRTKGLLLSTTNKIKHQILTSGNHKLINTYHEWVDTKKYLARLYTLSEEELRKENINLDSAETAANNKEKELSRMSASFAEDLIVQSTDYKTIAGFLDDEEAAVEIVRIPDYQYLKPDTSVCYAALILTKKMDYPEFIVLKNGKSLEEKYIQQYQRNMQRGAKTNSFFQIFWAPVHAHTKALSKLYVSMDGVYNQINLNTLQDAQGEFLMDKTNVVYVPNTKSVEKVKNSQAAQRGFAQKKAILFGNPNYAKDLNWDLVSEMPLPELPGTKVEVEKINQILSQKQWITKTYFSNDASEQNLKAVNNPQLFHIATHGFFLPDVRKADEKIFGVDPEKAKENPLLRSGLMFAGADNTIQQLGNPEQQSSNDGILNAYEAMLLNLSNTELVVLSACETGLGEVVNGEGVYGLQRAFQVAGAKTIMMSLWQVSDEVTQKLMTRFYGYLLETNNKIEAFTKAQKEIKKDYPSPFYWGAFILMNN
ncbi:MAG: CHAT domain-containing tetratricopeptide repeat protein [Bacteroidales bacterium]|jgi:CHAT domain-containing protein/Tfp pilus assembly protein PilF|nr:CHAT domain-containing tetratricopeptide repeat protein [Bacteroidales bacterium]